MPDLIDELPVKEKNYLFYISQQLNDIKEIQGLCQRVLKRAKKLENSGQPTKICLVEAMNDALKEELSRKT
ncbi:hypothetical protein [Formosa sp. 4Alg 33]|uniref:hypothetical protein n=1 Tax=Formosa sp. 4Alg 33 TaxID=3382189 RepID=UPI003D9C44FA